MDKNTVDKNYLVHFFDCFSHVFWSNCRKYKYEHDIIDRIIGNDFWEWIADYIQYKWKDFAWVIIFVFLKVRNGSVE